ncbi:efflux RND transporter permease subunit [Aliidiomarina quisquiliarum]|uniref:efflux RND transporter permease subunit n=1 Tax=Aliidiomarina quisquiliarum TaxID=2938947 RepID=UPI00208DF784|nr:efflux RND transporter permease subunit [Aliidiomarina quisquiliarum]MCO4320064.1 efflux RND transporter permease subunit [Aliidiomarina quisquiliarum]
MIRWFAGHPTAANLLMLIILAAGIFAAPALKRETFPDYRPTEVSISMLYRGASAADVEDAICRRLYDAVKGVEYLDEFRCAAQDNIATATAKMMAEGEPIRFLTELQTEVNAIIDLPARAEPPIVRELHRSDLVAAVAVGGDLPINQLEDYALRLEAKIMALEGVAQVAIHGVSQRQWQVSVPRDVLGQHGLSARTLARRVTGQNIDLPLGTLETRDRDVLLRFTDQRRSLADLALLVVASDSDGGEITLGQIATLREVGERAEEKVHFNGRPAVVLEVSKALQADALKVKDQLDQLIADESKHYHGLMELTVTQDMTSIVRDRLKMLVENGVMGFLLVVLVMSLFFRPSLAIWAVLGLPAAFMGAFIVMAFTGLSINMITLVGLLMAIGIVMDDAIVITDNIATLAQQGKSPFEAVVEGTRQVLPGVFSSYLTTAAVFLPLAFLVGELGAVLEVLPIVLVAALTASLIQAFWVLPHHLRRSVAKLEQKQASKLRQRFDQAFDTFREAVGRFTDHAIRFRYGVLAAVIVLILGSVGYIAGGHIGSEAMPEIDGDVLEARVLMPQGTPLARTEEVTAQVEAAMQRLNEKYSPLQPGDAALVVAMQTRFNFNRSAHEAGPHVATVIVDLLTAEQRSITLNELTMAWQQEIGVINGIERLIIQEPGFGPSGTPVEVRLQGDDLAELKTASAELAQFLSNYSAVYNVTDDLRLGKPQRAFALAEGAHGLGLTAEDVASQLRAAFLGDIVDRQRIGDHDVQIVVRQSEANRSSLDDIADHTIILPNGQQVPLDVVTTITERRDWSRINRIDGRRTVTVEANVNAQLSSGQVIVGELKKSWLPDFEMRYPNIHVVFEGQVARSAETGGSIGRGLLIGLVGIFIILSFQFRSYVEPLIVMLSIPLAFIGVLWGHVFMGYYLSMPSLIGAASLAGIVVNNAILLIQFIKTNRQQGLTTVIAAGQASRDRLRAILISSTTTIAGLLPLLAETSTQAGSIKPLAIAVVFGLLSATVLVIVVIPAFYVLLDDWGLAQEQEPSSH